MQDMNNGPEQPDDYRRQYANYNYVPDVKDLRVGFGPRLGAMLIDFLILTILFSVIFSITGFIDSYVIYFEKILKLSNGSNMEYIAALADKFIIDNQLSFVFLNLIPLFYGFLEVLLAGSPGKLLLNIRIANVERTKAGTSSLLKRYLFKYSNYVFSLMYYLVFVEIFSFLSMIMLLVVFIGCFFTLGRKRRAFHDLPGRTAVYRKDDLL